MRHSFPDLGLQRSWRMCSHFSSCCGQNSVQNPRKQVQDAQVNDVVINIITSMIITARGMPKKLPFGFLIIPHHPRCFQQRDAFQWLYKLCISTFNDSHDQDATPCEAGEGAFTTRIVPSGVERRTRPKRLHKPQDGWHRRPKG